MIYSYEGHYEFNDEIVRNWNSNAIGVYYCGYKNVSGELIPLYIGKGVSDKGVRGRLLDHLRDDNWSDVTHFGYQLCSTVSEAEVLELEKIQYHKPKYNERGK